MGVSKIWLGNPYIVQLLIIKFIGLLGCLSCVALAQEISGTVSGSVANFPDVGITCLGNLAIFVTSLLRGRLDLEVAARDVLATARGPKPEHIHRFGLTTCKNYEYKCASVVLLSYHSPNSSMRQFMKYISSAHNVQSILLECLPLRSAALLAEICNCNDECKCIVFCTVEEVTILLARRMPRMLKRLTDTLCLLLSRDCLTNGCHGCDEGMLYVDEGERLREGKKNLTTEAELNRLSVLETLDYIYQKPVPQEHTCICIPLHPAENDDWTDLMMRSLRSKDKEGRGVRVMASDALENYMALGAQQNYMSSEIVEAKGVEVTYGPGSLIVPRVIEIFLNTALTGWFRTDGFSTSVVARRAIRDYLVDSKGNGFAINAFVTYARVKSSQVNTDKEDVNVCQVLTFTGSRLSLRILSIIGASVNFICSFGWALLVAIEGGGLVKWHYTHSMPLNETRVVIIMAAIVIGLAMDCLHLYLGRSLISCPWNTRESVSTDPSNTRESVCRDPLNSRHLWNRRELIALFAVIALEIVCIVLCSTVAGVWGVKAFGRWIYSALQGLVWVKWAIGSYLLGERLSKYDSGPITTAVYKNKNGSRAPKWTDNGILVYSSAFLLNAILAGVRGKWDYVPKKNEV